MNWMKDLNKNIQSLRTDACIQKVKPLSFLRNI